MIPSPMATSEPTPDIGNPRLAMVKRRFSSSSGTRTNAVVISEERGESVERGCQQSVKVVAGGQPLRERIQALQMILKGLCSLHRKVAGTFYIQQGTLTVQVADKTLNASLGDVVQLPCNVVHSFKNTGNVNAKVLVVAEPAGLEQFFEEAFYPAADWPDAMPPMTDRFMARIVTAAQKCGLTFLPPA